MNILIFSAGLGVGAFVAVIAGIWLVGRVNKGGLDRAEKANALTAKLMQERNTLDKLKVHCMEGIGRALEAQRCGPGWTNRKENDETR